jgi:hypothetical protein
MSRRSANRSKSVDGEPSAADVCALSAKVQEPTRAGFLDTPFYCDVPRTNESGAVAAITHPVSFARCLLLTVEHTLCSSVEKVCEALRFHIWHLGVFGWLPGGRVESEVGCHALQAGVQRPVGVV